MCIYLHRPLSRTSVAGGVAGPVELDVWVAVGSLRHTAHTHTQSTPAHKHMLHNRDSKGKLKGMWRAKFRHISKINRECTVKG